MRRSLNSLTLQSHIYSLTLHILLPMSTKIYVPKWSAHSPQPEYHSDYRSVILRTGFCPVSLFPCLENVYLPGRLTKGVYDMPYAICCHFVIILLLIGYRVFWRISWTCFLFFIMQVFGAWSNNMYLHFTARKGVQGAVCQAWCPLLSLQVFL